MKKNKGILFFITGISGSGKSTLGKLIFKNIVKKYGPTLLFHGDDFRKIYKFNKYSASERFKFGCQNTLLIKKILNQKINVIYTAVSMSYKSQKFKRNNIDNYVEIFVKASVNEIVRLKKKKIYHNNIKNIVGIDICPEYPKKPNIVLNNNLKKPLKIIAKELINKIYRAI
jgi:adenylylsulfate kinase-like enzyme